MKNIIKETLNKVLIERWSSGFGLDDDQILGLTTSDHQGQQRYYFNKYTNKFVPVILMDKYHIDDFDCDKTHLATAKDSAIKQDLRTDIIKLGQVRARH
tara:strand:+ start:34628 stop:34924 length:297 start_codon:yes stop_codon:yes gene_type:complete